MDPASLAHLDNQITKDPGSHLLHRYQLSRHRPISTERRLGSGDHDLVPLVELEHFAFLGIAEWRSRRNVVTRERVAQNKLWLRLSGCGDQKSGRPALPRCNLARQCSGRGCHELEGRG